MQCYRAVVWTDQPDHWGEKASHGCLAYIVAHNETVPVVANWDFWTPLGYAGQWEAIDGQLWAVLQLYEDPPADTVATVGFLPLEFADGVYHKAVLDYVALLSHGFETDTYHRITLMPNHPPLRRLDALLP